MSSPNFVRPTTMTDAKTKHPQSDMRLLRVSSGPSAFPLTNRGRFSVESLAQ